MFTDELVKHLSYACGCPLDIREKVNIVNGICPNHPKNKLLFDGVAIEAYKKAIKGKKKLDRKRSEIV